MKGRGMNMVWPVQKGCTWNRPLRQAGGRKTADLSRGEGWVEREGCS